MRHLKHVLLCKRLNHMMSDQQKLQAANTEIIPLKQTIQQLEQRLNDNKK